MSNRETLLELIKNYIVYCLIRWLVSSLVIGRKWTKNQCQMFQRCLCHCQLVELAQFYFVSENCVVLRQGFQKISLPSQQ